MNNRYRRARDLAGLSIEQATKLLGMNAVVSLGVIESADMRASAKCEARMAEIYWCSVEWLRGDDIPVLEELRRIPGFDELTFHDRDVVIEFAQSLPKKAT